MTGDFPRTLGVPGEDTPRFPEAPPVLALVPAAPPAPSPLDALSHESTPAADDLRNLLMIIAPLQDSLVREAVKRLATSALEKIEHAVRELEAYDHAHMAVVA